MEDNQKALIFSGQLDEMLQTDFAADIQSSEFGDLLDVAHKLSNADFSRESHIRQSLYSRLQPSQSAHPTNSWQRKLLVASLSTIMLLSVIVTVPPIRALAQEIIKRLQTITLTNQPSLFEPYLTATPTPDANNPPVMP